LTCNSTVNFIYKNYPSALQHLGNFYFVIIWIFEYKAMIGRDVEGAVPYDLRTDGYLSNNRREGKPLPYGIPPTYCIERGSASLGI